MRTLADKWLALEPPVETYAFLRHSFAELVRHNGHVCGQKIRTPKLIRAS